MKRNQNKLGFRLLRWLAEVWLRLRTIEPQLSPTVITWFYRILLGFTGFYWVLLGFTGFYWVTERT